MDRLTFQERYLAGDHQGRIKLLVGMADQLTLLGRTTYEAGTENLEDPSMLRHLNEALHRLLGQLRDLIHDKPGRYPDQAFIAVMTENFDRLQAALDRRNASPREGGE